MIKIITCNIRFDNPHDKGQLWSVRKYILAQIIHEESPLILATQEGREPQLRELSEILPHYNLIDNHRSWIPERMYPCFFVRNNLKLEILKSYDIWLSETPHLAGSSSFNSEFPRLATFMIMKIKGQEVLIINTHLDHKCETTRSKQMEVLISQIKREASLPIVLCGDFNSPPDGEVRAILNKELNLIDPWITLNKEEKSSYHHFDPLNTEGKRIDWILHSPDFKCNQIYFSNKQKDNTFPSDHYPVIAKLDFLSNS